MAVRYRKVDPRIWNDAKFRKLSDRSKLLFFMLLTHPNMTALGAMRATVAGLAEELGWEVEDFREAFHEVLAEGMAKHDPRACLLALPNFLRYNPPESPNVVKAWVSAIDLLPECELKTLVIQRAEAFAKGMSEAFFKALPEAFAKGMPYQEQELEQEVGGEPPTTPGADAPVGEGAKTARTKTPKQEPSTAEPLPDWMPTAEWDAFVAMRKAMGKSIPFTEAARRGIVSKLDKLRDAGQDPAAVLEASVRNGWRDVFAIKMDRSNFQGGAARTTSKYAAAGATIFEDATHV